MRIKHLMSKENGKRKTVIGILLAGAVTVTACIALLYGDLNNAVTQREVFAKISTEYREKSHQISRIEMQKVPDHFINALLVHEDSRFYKHKGIDMKSVIRATATNIKSFFSGGPLYVDGGSSITQQLAKQFIHNPEKSLKRKLKELKVARVLEKNFTKDEILEMYLNMSYFGNGAFGLKNASELYFGHDYTRMTLSESAMLVPFLDAPAKYNVLQDPVSAELRQKQLLQRIAVASQNS